jgi:hypothetical protein
VGKVARAIPLNVFRIMFETTTVSFTASRAVR